VELKELEVYRLALTMSTLSWKYYAIMDWQSKKTMGDQWITATDSIGANIAEGFGRYHYLDKNKFNYNARGSLLEVFHWLTLLDQRGVLLHEKAVYLLQTLYELHYKLNNYINATKRQVNGL
jgi:four helix bundle protein